MELSGMWRSATLSGLIVLVATNANALELKLRCDGTASKLETQTTIGSVSGDIEVDGSSTSFRTGQQPDRLLVEFSDDGGGRIRPPVVILPPLKGAGLGGGWWKLEKLVVGDTEITARFRLNPLNNPVVRIDRTTGDIEVIGYAYTRFIGRCSKAAAADRKF